MVMKLFKLASNPRIKNITKNVTMNNRKKSGGSTKKR
jgi:hypothetical protein